MEKLPGLLESQKEKIENLNQQKKLLNDIATKPWTKSDKLQEMKAELRLVESRLLTIGQDKEPVNDQRKANQTEKAIAKRQDHSIEVS